MGCCTPFRAHRVLGSKDQDCLDFQSQNPQAISYHDLMGAVQARDAGAPDAAHVPAQAHARPV